MYICVFSPRSRYTKADGAGLQGGLALTGV